MSPLSTEEGGPPRTAETPGLAGSAVVPATKPRRETCFFIVRPLLDSLNNATIALADGQPPTEEAHVDQDPVAGRRIGRCVSPIFSPLFLPLSLQHRCRPSRPPERPRRRTIARPTPC